MELPCKFSNSRISCNLADIDQLHLGAEFPHGLNFDRDRIVRHHDRAALVQLLTCKRQRLPEISGRRGKQVMMRYVGSHVPCPAELKVAGVLERLGCQEDVQAQVTVESNGAY